MRKEPMERTRLRGQRPRILMVGNSLTSANGMPDLLAALTGAQVAAVTRGGARLAEFCNPATKTGSRVAALLEAEPFEFLIMQDMSHLAASNPRAHVRAAVRASELARRNGAVPVLLGTWAYRADCPRLEKLGLAADRMRELMSEGALRAAQDGVARLIDLAAVAAELGDGFYARDGIHPSAEGSRRIARAIADALERP